MHECSQTVQSIVGALLCEMQSRKSALFLCLGKVLTHSSGVGVRQAVVVEQVL